jgi:hypothetical protein
LPGTNGTVIVSRPASGSARPVGPSLFRIRSMAALSASVCTTTSAA